MSDNCVFEYMKLWNYNNVTFTLHSVLDKANLFFQKMMKKMRKKTWSNEKKRKFDLQFMCNILKAIIFEFVVENVEVPKIICLGRWNLFDFYLFIRICERARFGVEFDLYRANFEN